MFLAELPPEETDRLLAGRTVLQEGYLGLEDPAHEQLVDVRDDGFAVNDGETTYEEYGVSAPVRDYRGEVVGCITASAPRARVQHQQSQSILREAVLQAAERVSTRLGSLPGKQIQCADGPDWLIRAGPDGSASRFPLGLPEHLPDFKQGNPREVTATPSRNTFYKCDSAVASRSEMLSNTRCC